MSRMRCPKRRRGDVKRIAQSLGVTPRTLENWVHASTRPTPRRVGRPGPTAEERRAAQWAVAGLARMDRRVSCRCVRALLQDRFRTRVLDEATRQWKQHGVRKVQRRIAIRRVKITVHAPDVIWGMDGSHMGRTPESAPVECQATRDRCSRRTLGLALGRPACGRDVVHILQAIIQRTGRRPLVFASDNGSNFTSEEVEAYLKEQQIVHLRNVPHTPQHNAASERGLGELKEISGLGKGVVIEDLRAAALRLQSAWHVLDHHHARPALGGQTAEECYQAGPQGVTMPDRELFYRSVCDAQEAAVAAAPNARARRIAMREATFATLERFTLITRTRGGVLFRAIECEGES